MNKVGLFFVTTLGAIAGSVVTLFFITAIYGGDIRALIPSSPHILSPDLEGLSHVDKFRLERLIDKNIIFSAEDLLGQIGTFYSTIIVFLIAIITVISLFTLFFVKVSAEEKAEAQAKSVAKQVIDDKITPKIQQIDAHMNKFSDVELMNKLDDLLQYKILDSVQFWDKIAESIYAKSEESLEDYHIESMSSDIRQNAEEIKRISSAIQQMDLHLEELMNDTGDETVVIMDREVGNGNSH